MASLFPKRFCFKALLNLTGSYRRFKVQFRWFLCLIAGSVCLTVHAADLASPTAPNPPVDAVRPPTPPRVPSPVESFRQLLSANPVERAALLAGKPERQRQLLTAKLQEYAALSPEERELRLRQLDLRWYLLPLMRIPATNRVSHLSKVPESNRKLVEERLEQWDRLPQEIQKEILENEMTIDYFVRMEASTPAQRQVILTSLSPERHQELERELETWRALPSERRQRMYEHFNHFFELTSREREKILSAISDAERQQMEATLQTFQKLPVAQRRLCIESFSKFAEMTPEDRNQFLKDAERWQAMSANERHAWRDLVLNLPPLPPGLGEPEPPPLPRPNSLPPSPVSPISPASVTSNSPAFPGK